MSLFFTMTGCKNAPNGETTSPPPVETTTSAQATASEVPKISAPANAPFDVNTTASNSTSFGLPNLIADSMVLQRDTPLNIWGRYIKDGPVAVIINNQAYFGECKNGSFSIITGAISAGGPYDITIRSATEKKVIRNVLFGDVYLCGGQSNMEMTLAATENTALPDTYANNNVRYIKVEKKSSEVPLDTCIGTWMVGTSYNIKNLSAVAVVYGNTLQKKFNIPIGIIISCVGGTMASTWLPPEEAKTISNIPYVNHANYPYTSEPSYFYNGMISPLTNVKLKGVVWYQGEGQSNRYDELLTNIIKGWRRAFDNADLYFIIIQLPRNDTGNPAVWATVREAQARTAKAVKNVAYSVNIDLGEKTNVHPKDKEPVGIRAAMAAMSLIYGEKGTLFGPTYKGFSISGNKIFIELNNTGSGLKLTGDGKGFEICGADGKYYEAKASIEGNKIVLTSDSISTPINARYCYADYPESVSLFNNEGLPCEPFRTEAS